MPQIDQLSESWYFASQAFWLVFVFGAIFFVIGRGMLPKVEAVVDARDATIARDVAAAKAARDAADAIEADLSTRTNAARADALGVIAAAKTKSAKDSEKRLAKAAVEIDARMATAEADIAAARASAMAEVEGIAGEVAHSLVTRLSGADISAAALNQAVKAQMHG